MSELTDYFVRHYSLVINNDQGSYLAACAEIGSITRASGVTVSEYLAMDDKERRSRFAEEIGEALLDLVREWCEKEITDCHYGSPGQLLVSEIMRYDGADLAWELGTNFLPENAEADSYFAEDEEEEEDGE